MLYFFVISSSPSFLALRKHLFPQLQSIPDAEIFSFQYAPEADLGNNDNKRIEEYDRLFHQVNQAIRDNDQVHDRFIGIIDCRASKADNAWQLHALREIPGMMILSFPEVLWLPLYKNGQLGSKTMDLETAIDLSLGGYTPLFDGDGLRGILLSRARRGPQARDIRRNVAFSIDEETHFAFMNTYTAFRFGYRGFPVMTGRCAEHLLRGAKPCSRQSLRKSIPCAVDFDDPGKTTRPLVSFVAVFEDICLNFPDRNKDYADNRIPFGTKRDEYYPMIPGADLRVIATATPRYEKVANVGEDKKVTLNQYFGKYCFDYRSVSCHSRKMSEQIASFFKKNYMTFRYRFLNRTGGWWGYGLVNAVSMGASILVLGVVFLTQHFYCFFLVLLVIYLWFSSREWICQRIVRYKSRNGAPERSFFFKRLQWPFMPKYYVSHQPIPCGKNGSGMRFWEEAHKPFAGIFDFRNTCGLPDGTGFRGVYSTSEIKHFYRNAINKGVYSEDDNDGPDDHASRGTVLEIAMRLVRRAEQMKDKIVDVEGAVHAAVLTDVALEMLDHKTPAASMEALQWKHYFEILAECEFVGIRAHLNIEDRYIDIHNAMGKICRINRRVVRKDVFVSGMAEIIDNLAALLKKKGKLEEAAFFIAHSRRLHRKLLFTPVRAFLAYPEWALRTKWNFLISFGCFFTLFLLYWLLVVKMPFCDSVVVACKVMLARLPEDMDKPSITTIVMLARQVAILHLCFVAARFFMFMDRK